MALANRRSHSRSTVTSLIRFMSLLIMLLQFALFILRAQQLITFPYDLTSGEGLVLRDAIQIRQGDPLYTDPNQYPYIVSVYPPVFPMIVALASWITGVGLQASRVVSVISTLLICVGIGLIIYLKTRCLFSAIVSGLSYLSSVFVYQWSVFGRVDTLAILWSIVAVLIVFHRLNPPSVILAAVVCTVGIFTKQTAIAAPLAITIYILLTDRRLGILFLLSLGLMGGTLFAALTWLTHGQFYLQTIQDNVQSYSVRALLSFVRAFVLLHPGFLLIAAVYVGSKLWRREMISLPMLYFLTAGALVWTAGRAGSSINYFLEFIAAAIVLLGLYWGELEGRVSTVGTLVPLLLVGQVLWSVEFPYTPLARYYQPDHAFTYVPTESQKQGCQRLDEYIRSANGMILAEEVGAVIANNKEAVGSAWVFNVLQGQGLIDQGYMKLKEAVEEKQFSLVLLHWQSYPPDLLLDVVAHYHKVDTLNCVFNWEVFTR